MKIAVASDDGKFIASHFGRTRGFLVYTIEDGRVADKSYIENRFTHHAQGHHEHGHSHDHGHDHHHSHHGILEALSGARVVISRGMGRRLLDDFERVGKEVYVTGAENADEAVEQYLAGSLEHDPEKTCRH